MSIEGARDWAIIILALLSMIQTLLVIVLVLLLIRFALMLRSKTEPILDSAKGTVSKIETTSGMVTDVIVKPLVRVVSLTAGVRKTLGVLTRLSQRKGGKK